MNIWLKYHPPQAKGINIKLRGKETEDKKKMSDLAIYCMIPYSVGNLCGYFKCD